jgi:hypothetical protein
VRKYKTKRENIMTTMKGKNTINKLINKLIAYVNAYFAFSEEFPESECLTD